MDIPPTLLPPSEVLDRTWLVWAEMDPVRFRVLVYRPGTPFLPTPLLLRLVELDVLLPGRCRPSRTGLPVCYSTLSVTPLRVSSARFSKQTCYWRWILRVDLQNPVTSWWLLPDGVTGEHASLGISPNHQNPWTSTYMDSLALGPKRLCPTIWTRRRLFRDGSKQQWRRVWLTSNNTPGFQRTLLTR